MRALLLVLVIATIGCGARPDQDLYNLQALWSHGDRAGALVEAHAVVDRYAEANGVAVETLELDARALWRRLSEEPIPPADARGPVKIDMRSLEDPRGGLDAELRAALAHPEALVAIRAAVTLGELAMERLAPELLVLITAPGPIRLQRKTPELRDPTQGWLVTKVVALHALQRLAKP